MDPHLVRDELREGDSPSLRRRRWVARLSALGLVDFAVVSLYQVGAVRRLPDLPGRLVDSNRVNASVEAYPFGVPDAPVGALGYAANLVLAAAGGSRRTGRPPALDLLLAGTVGAAAVGAVKYLWAMATKERRVCPYCLVGAAVNFALVPLVWPEARDAWRAVRR